MATLIEDYYNNNNDAAIASMQFMDDLSVGSAINDEAFDNMDDIFTKQPQYQAPPPMMTQGPSNTNSNNTTTLQSSTLRMVSLPSMSQVNSSSRKRTASSSTPYDSLKALVKNKQQRRASSNGAKVTLPGARVAKFLRQPQAFSSIQPQQQQQSFFKRRKTEEEKAGESLIPTGESELHRAAAAGDAEAIAAALQHDPVQAARAIRITSIKKMYNPGTYQMEDQTVPENYTFALNLAIRAKAAPAVLERLAKAAPGVLAEADGDAQECPLAVLFKTNPTDGVTADTFLLQNPEGARVTDRKHNTVLHMACQNGAALDTIRHLVILYPEALFLHNAYGETPVDVAQRSIHRCSDQVAAYLWDKQAEMY